MNYNMLATEQCNRMPYLYRVFVFGMLNQLSVAQVACSVIIVPSPVMSPRHLSAARYTPFYDEHLSRGD